MILENNLAEEQKTQERHAYNAFTVKATPKQEYNLILESLCLAPSKQEPRKVSLKDTNFLRGILHDFNKKMKVEFSNPKIFLVEGIPGGMTYMRLDGSEEKTIVQSPHFFVPEVIHGKIHAMRGFYAHKVALIELLGDPETERLEKGRRKPFTRFVYKNMPRFFERNSTFAQNTIELEQRMDDYAARHGFREEIDAFRKYVPQVIFREHMF